MILPSLLDIPSPTVNLPTPSLTNLQGSPNVLATLLIRDGPDCTDISIYRTTTNIVLSCLTTILACTWVALHLGVPKSDKSTEWKCFWRRFGWMIVALIAPEYFTGVAIRERLIAKKYMDEWNANCVSLCSSELVEIQGKTSEQYKRELKNKNYDSRWTLTHGFLAGMGGFRLYDDNDSKPKKFRPGAKIFEDPRMRSIVQQVGLISAEEIKDKSKRDGMSKLIVVAQTTWFIVQCLARWATRLPVTELEIVTLAYAVQNIFIYTLWWHKPQSLAVPYRLYLEKEEEISKDPEVKGESKIEEVPLMRRSPSPAPAEEAQDTNARLARSSGRKQSLLADKEWVQPTYSGVQGLIIKIFGGEDEDLNVFLAGTIFGALHLIPLWLSLFPSNVEKKLWQVSAFYITVAPLGVFVVKLVCDTLFGKDGLVITVFGNCAAVAYMAAFLSIEWTRFIPHF